MVSNRVMRGGSLGWAWGLRKATPRVETEQPPDLKGAPPAVSTDLVFSPFSSCTPYSRMEETLIFLESMIHGTYRGCCTKPSQDFIPALGDSYYSPLSIGDLGWREVPCLDRGTVPVSSGGAGGAQVYRQNATSLH